MGLSSLSNIARGDELVHALAKVRSFIPADRAKDIELKGNQICIDVSPWMGSGHLQPYLEKIKTALQESRLLSFAYIVHHGKKTTRMVEPYQLVLKSSHWYLQDYRHFLYTEFYRALMAGNALRRCHNCGRYFLLTAGYNTCYCNNIAPGETKRTCRKVGAHKKSAGARHCNPCAEGIRQGLQPPEGQKAERKNQRG